MRKRALLIVLSLLFLLLASAAILLSSGQFSRVINTFLPADWQISTANGGLSANRHGVGLPQIRLTYQQCPLVAIDNLSLQWQAGYHLAAQKAVVDYACFDRFSSEDDSPANFSLNALLLLIPASELEVQTLEWRNLPNDLPPRLQALVDAPTQVKLTYSGKKLTASLKQQAVEIEADFTNGRLAGNVSYHPQAAERHNLLFSTQLNENILSLPTYFEGDYHWELPKNLLPVLELQAGSVGLTWQTDKEQNLLGNLTFASEIEPQNKLDLPFKFDFNQLEIFQGKFNWAWLPDFPINGSTTATLIPKNIMHGEIFPLETQFRMNLFSAEKHTLSLATTSGVIESPDYFILPLTLSGYVKYHGFKLFSQATIDANQSGLTFSPKSLFQIVSGQERLLTIKDLTIPLGTVEINRYGVSGPLQAHLKAETPDFSDIDLKLKGQAHHFKMGFLDFFESFEGKGKKNLWEWRLTGDAKLKSLDTKVALDGLGNWRENLMQFTQLNGEVAPIKMGAVSLAKSAFRLTEPVKFFYEDWVLSGGAELESTEMRFDYGGKLLRPKAKLNLAGELETLQFKGEVQANKVGPIKLNAQRQLKTNVSEFIGDLEWAKQPAQVFQSLIPPRSGWIIKSGEVEGNTHFYTTEKGVNASGQISITDGGLSLPSGEINGIDFALPYQLTGNQVEFGQHKPIAVKIAEINTGLPITDVHVNIDGYYPYTAKKPLNLRKLSLNLLGGSLAVEHFALPQVKVAHLELKDIRLEQIMSLANYQQIDLRGKAKATLPFWLSGEPCYICEGKLTQTEESTLKISETLMKAISASSGYSERILLYLLNDTKMKEMDTTINVPQSGDMLLTSKLKLQLNQQEKAKVNFNYTHKENVFSLWHLINSTSYVEQEIENRIYKKLDRHQ